MAPADAAALTAQLRAHLQAYLAHSGSIAQTLRDANALQAELDTGGADVRARLEGVYDRIDEQTEAEFAQLDVAMDLLDAIDAAQAPLAADVAAVKKAQHKKRTAKADGSSRAGSPASSAAPSPLPSYAGSPPLAPSGGRPPSSSVSASGAGGNKPPALLPASAAPPAHHPTPIAPAPGPGSASGGGGAARKGGAVPSLKARKDAIAAQLPLRPGRPIAVKESKKNAPPAPATAPDNFILGRIVMCLQGDKNRYTVEDVDYDPANPTPEGGKWNTTIKAIIPLPEKGDERTYPDYDYPPGMYVLACYPETTSFYRAVIASGPHATTTGAGKKKEVQRVYRLTFDDDEGAIRDVPVELVCDPAPL
ncbi:hypothetical protein JCM3770_004413 [Rhodotorula araucariae]